MDPMCISLVHQYLDSTYPALADQFKNKYRPQKTNVELKEVLLKWKEEQLARGLVYQHLKAVAPSLAVEFLDKHRCSLEATPKHLVGEVQKKLLALANIRKISKVEDEGGAKHEHDNNWKKYTSTSEEQLAIGLVYQHLKTVAPSLAVEFRDNHLCCSETAPEHLLGELQKKVWEIASTREINKDESGGERGQSNNG